MDKSEKLEYKERLLLRSMGAFGYLKFPKQFVERFRHDREKVADPEAFLSEDGDEVRLTFVWNKNDLEQSRRED